MGRIGWAVLKLKSFLADIPSPQEHDKPYFTRSFESFNEYKRYVRTEQHWLLTLIRGERNL